MSGRLNKWKEAFSRKQPEEQKIDDLGLSSFSCSLTMTPFTDPVVTEDGHTYQRDYFEKWVSEKQRRGEAVTSPLTGMPLKTPETRVNRQLMMAIAEYKRDILPRLERAKKFEAGISPDKEEVIRLKKENQSLQEQLEALGKDNQRLRLSLQEKEQKSAEEQKALQEAHQKIEMQLERSQEIWKDETAALRKQIQVMELVLDENQVLIEALLEAKTDEPVKQERVRRYGVTSVSEAVMEYYLPKASIFAGKQAQKAKQAHKKTIEQVSAYELDFNGGLAYSIQQGQLSQVEITLGQGAQVDVQYIDMERKTPLMLATERYTKNPIEMRKIVLRLLEHNPSLHLTNNQGKNILHFAAQAGSPWLLFQFLKRGADPLKKDHRGRAPRACLAESSPAQESAALMLLLKHESLASAPAKTEVIQPRNRLALGGV